MTPAENLQMPQTDHLYREKFDPTQYLMDLSKKKYLEVGYRIQWINHDAPIPEYDSFDISTELLHIFEYEDPKTKRHVREAVFKATVTLFKAGQVIKRATAHGSESNVDFPAFWEKAETKAIGRALAEAGFGTQFAVADFDEGQKPSPIDGKMGPALSDSPVKTAAPAAARPAPAPRPAAPAPTPAPAPAAAPVAPAAASAAFNRTEALTWLQSVSGNPAVAQILAAAVNQNLSHLAPQDRRVSVLDDGSLEAAYQAAKLAV